MLIPNDMAVGCGMLNHTVIDIRLLDTHSIN